MESSAYCLHKEMPVLSTYCDPGSRLGLSQSFGLLQDCMSEFFGALGCDGTRLKPLYGCAWIITRTAYEAYRFPVWNTVMHLESAMTRLTRLIVELDTTVCDGDGEVLLRGKQELCLLDLQKRHPVPNDFLPVLAGNLSAAKRWDTRFARLTVPENAVLVPDLLQTVHAQDTDMNGHCNNIALVRMLLNGLSPAAVNKADPCRVDVSFLNECRQGSRLRLYAEELPEASVFALQKEGESGADGKIAICRITPLH